MTELATLARPYAEAAFKSAKQGPAADAPGGDAGDRVLGPHDRCRQRLEDDDVEQRRDPLGRAGCVAPPAPPRARRASPAGR